MGGLPLGANQGEAVLLLEPDGNTMMMILLSAHLAARQEIVRSRLHGENSQRSTLLNISATHGHSGGQAVVAQAVHHEHMRQS